MGDRFSAKINLPPWVGVLEEYAKRIKFSDVGKAIQRELFKSLTTPQIKNACFDPQGAALLL